MTPDQVNALLGLLQQLQTGALAVLDSLGLAGTAHGQPAWPFDSRIAAEMLRFDPGHARRVALTLAALAAAAVLLLLALAWRRARWALLLSATALLLAAPWPDSKLLLAPAYPTSFHTARGGFTPASINAGARLYAANCAACHGLDGGGEGPLASSLPMWPPNLNGPLLGQRLDGELFWHVLQGLQDRHGKTTMPGFGDRLSDDDVWALIDFMQANAAGQTLRRSGAWERPVRSPNFDAECDGRATRVLHAWQGQRLRLIAVAPGRPPPREDPRLVTVLLTREHDAAPPSDVACRVRSDAAWDAVASVAGVAAPDLAGLQFLVDRDGWLRARSGAGQANWSESDLVCRGDTVRASTDAAPAADGLSLLIERIDAEPVRVTRGGFPHG